MNNTEYLIKLYIPYNKLGCGDYITKKILYNDDNDKFVCNTCKHIYIPEYNCTTTYDNEIYILECKGCKNIYQNIISKDIFVMEDVFDLFN